MKNKEKKEAAGKPDKELLDGGTVAAALTSDMRNRLDSHCRQIDRPQAWVFRKALEQYFAHVAV